MDWVPEVYDKWVDCQKQVHKFGDNCYKGYATREEVVAKWRNHLWKKN
jgi:viroplasmin and RNaseH domain-containing protein